MIKRYKVQIYKKPTSYSFEEDKFTIESLEVLGENDDFIVFNDDYFTKITKKPDRYYDVLDRPRINIRTTDSLLSNGIFYTLYTTTNKRPATIRNEIHRQIGKKFGWMMDSVDLSIIK